MLWKMRWVGSAARRLRYSMHTLARQFVVARSLFPPPFSVVLFLWIGVVMCGAERDASARVAERAGASTLGDRRRGPSFQQGKVPYVVPILGRRSQLQCPFPPWMLLVDHATATAVDARTRPPFPSAIRQNVLAIRTQHCPPPSTIVLHQRGRHVAPRRNCVCGGQRGLLRAQHRRRVEQGRVRHDLVLRTQLLVVLFLLAATAAVVAIIANRRHAIIVVDVPAQVQIASQRRT